MGGMSIFPNSDVNLPIFKELKVCLHELVGTGPGSLKCIGIKYYITYLNFVTLKVVEFKYAGTKNT